MKKTILITGTSSGIGRATTAYFSAQGWNVIATMRQPEKEQELIKQDNVHVVRLDVQMPDTITSAIREGIERFGAIDVVVNNAGYGQFGLFEAVTPQQAKYDFETNVFGVMNVMRAILPYFRQQKKGMIINISSAGGRIGLPAVSIYLATKFALEGFTESLFYELSSQNIAVKLVEPGGVGTNFFKTATENLATDNALSSYNDFLTKANKYTDSLYQLNVTAEEVAEVIYEAATDGENTLRYIVGNAAKSWIKARTTLSDDDYMKHMYGMFNAVD